MSIERFKLGHLPQQNLNDYLPSGVTGTIDGMSPSPEIDIELSDPSALPDLQEYMALLGWDFVESNPDNPRTVIALPWQPNVFDLDLTAPPVSPTDGDRYIVGSPATGAWAGHEDEIAQWDATTSSWLFTVPSEGYTTWVEDEDIWYTYDGTTWKQGGGGTGGSVTFLFGGDSNNSTSYSIANGTATLPTPSVLDVRTQFVSPGDVTLFGLSWNTQGADATTAMNILVNGLIEQTVFLGSATGSNVAINVPVVGGDLIAIGVDSGTAPRDSIWTLVGVAL